MANSWSTKIITHQKEVNSFMQRIELKEKPYNILNLIFDSTLILFLLLLTTYSNILKIYLATFIEKNTL